MKAAELARALGFKRAGNQWLGCCVAHDDRNPSMIVFEGKTGATMVRCLAGCDPLDIIKALRNRGLWDGSGRSDDIDIGLDELRKQRDREIAARDRRRSSVALSIWGQARDPNDTPVEDYLKGRGLELPMRANEVIRYHQACPKGSGAAIEYVPALIALMRDPVSFDPVGINRLFLDIDQNAKLGGMMLGKAGAMMLTGRHDTFWDDLSFCPRLCVCEGLETGLALGRMGDRCVWALGSAGAIARFPVIFGVGHLLICADNDPTGMRAAIECAERWNASSHQKATILMPSAVGADFADLVGGQDG